MRSIRHRRSYTDTEKLKLVEEWTRSGLPESAFARQVGVSANILSKWKRKLHAEAEPSEGFVRLVLSKDNAREPERLAFKRNASLLIEVTFGSGTIIRIFDRASAERLERLVARALG